jgi:hypothetical protein
MSAPLPWFRLYNRIIDDKKIKLLAFEDRWHFVALCCLKSSGELDEPDADLRSRQVAIALGVQLAELDEIARRLRAVKLIGDDLQPLAWDELQFRSDNSTARVQAYREKQKKQRRNDAKRCGNVSETVQETDTDTELSSSNEDDRASGDAPALKPEHVQDRWNTTAERIGRPRILVLTPERRQLVKARIAQYDLDAFRAVFGKVEASAFLRGELRWKGATFDWLMKKANFQKVLEGNYDD